MVSEALWVVEIPQGWDLDHCRDLGNCSVLSVPPCSSVLFCNDSMSVFFFLSVWRILTTVCLFAIEPKQWGQWIIDHFQHNLIPKCNDYFYRWIFIKSIILYMGLFIYLFLLVMQSDQHTPQTFSISSWWRHKYTWWQFICPLWKRKLPISFLVHLKLDCLWIFLLSSWVLFILSLLTAHQLFCRLFVSLLINYCFCSGEDLKSKF